MSSAWAKNPPTTAKAPLDCRYGLDTNLVQIDVFHQIHCLNMLLQTLMRSARVDVITHSWRETQRNPFRDFSVSGFRGRDAVAGSAQGARCLGEDPG
jgi:hypothetical protein